MADANVLLRIGADVGNAITGVNSFIQIVGRAGKAIADFARENDAFVRATRNATVSIREADAATGGLIDTTTLYQQTAKLTIAGVQLTEKEYRAVAVAAAEMGKITGDATGEFVQLTNALTTGSTRAMRAYGVEVKEGGTQSDRSAQAVAQLVEKFGDATVEADTLTEGIFVLTNNISTLTGQLWRGINDETSLGGALSSVNKTLGNFSNALELMPSIVGNVEVTMLVFRRSLYALLAPLQEVEDKILRVFGAEGLGAAGRARSDLQKSIRATELEFATEGAINLAKQRRAMAERVAADGAGGGGGTGRRRGGGRGSAGGGGYDMDFVQEAEDRRSIEDDLLSRAGGDRLESFGDPSGMHQVKDPFAKTPDQIQQEITARRELAELRTAELAAEREYWNQSVDFSRTWSESWIQSIDEVDAKMSVISMTMQGFEDITRQVVTTIAMGGKVTVETIAEMVRGVALNLGIEATVQALKNTALAIAEGVMSWGASPRVQGFATAAAQWTATAAAAFGVAGGSGAIARRGVGSGSGSSAQSSYSGGQGSGDYSDSMAGRRDSGRTDVTVILEGDAESLFRAVVAQNERQMQAGYSSLERS